LRASLIILLIVSEQELWIYTQINGFWSIKIRILETGDLLRIPEKYQKYRYAKISQLLEAGQFCRYVGDIFNFERAVFLQMRSSYL
jgi:hypothetical protein